MGDSALQITLNSGIYYNRTAGECPYDPMDPNGENTCDFSENGLTEKSKTLIGDATWNLGGLADTANTTTSFYEKERGTEVYNGRPTKWVGKIGLIYPSDYGYATSGGNTTDRSTCLSYMLNDWYNYEDCYNNNWIFLNYKKGMWTITPALLRYFIHDMNLYGNISVAYANNGRLVAPTTYLSSHIRITSGVGTKEQPYLLSL